MASHWVLDFVSHRADLPLWWGGPKHLSTRDFPDAKAAAIHLVEKDFAAGIDGIPLRVGL